MQCARYTVLHCDTETKNNKKVVLSQGNHCNFVRWRPAAILDLIEPEITLFDLLNLKPYPTTKHEVDWMTHCGDMANRNSTLSQGVHLGPPFCGKEKGRS